MTEHFNKLTPAELERLACLAEECAEIIQVVGKILRHGYESTYPACGTTNRQMLERELGDALAVVGMMSETKDIDRDVVDKAIDAKLYRIGTYLHHHEMA
mgnify:CR=1 FL=1